MASLAVEPPESLEPTQGQRSPVWEYFRKDEDKHIECRLCNKPVKAPGGNTSNLLSHLKIKHAKKFEEVKKKLDERKAQQSSKATATTDKGKQTTLTGLAAAKTKLDHGSARCKRITRKVAGMMIHDFQPYSLVEDRGFKELMEELEPRYVIPHRTTFSRSVVPEMYREVKDQVRGKLGELQEGGCKAALTTDIWTSAANDAYLGLTCHFLTTEYHLVSVCLSVEHISGRHTGVNIAAYISQVLNEYDIIHSAVSAVVADNASNMDVAVRVGNWDSRHCFGHTLQLAIKDGLKMSTDVQEMLQSAKSIVAFFHRSQKGTEKLKEFQSQLNLPQHKMLIECPTRWNSTFYMLQRLLEQKAAVSVMCASTGGPHASLSPNEWRLLEELVSLLEPLEQATRELSTEKSISCSKVIPLLNALFQALDFDDVGKPDGLKRVRRALIASMRTRWPDYEEDEIYRVSTILDPRFKDLPFTSAGGEVGHFFDASQ